MRFSGSVGVDVSISDRRNAVNVDTMFWKKAFLGLAFRRNFQVVCMSTLTMIDKIKTTPTISRRNFVCFYKVYGESDNKISDSFSLH